MLLSSINQQTIAGEDLKKEEAFSSIEIPFHICQNGHHQQINKQVLASLWRKGNPFTLLLGMQTGTATVESSMEISQNI